jgi:hypothetical protein
MPWMAVRAHARLLTMADTSTSQRKRKYEKPVFCSLGELAKGVGANCKEGVTVTQANCESGGIANNCKTGATVA